MRCYGLSHHVTSLQWCRSSCFNYILQVIFMQYAVETTLATQWLMTTLMTNDNTLITQSIFMWLWRWQQPPTFLVTNCTNTWFDSTEVQYLITIYMHPYVKNTTYHSNNPRQLVLNYYSPTHNLEGPSFLKRKRQQKVCLQSSSVAWHPKDGCEGD